MNDRQLVQEFRKMSTTSVSDAMDKLGISGSLLGIKPVVAGRPICGRAFTVRYVPCGPVKGTVGDFLDDVQPGQVVVIANDGRDYCTVWGDIMSVTASRMGIEGTVIDGVCRDVPGIKKSGYAIYTKGWYTSTGKDRVQMDAVNEPIEVCGVRVLPGDIMLGDDTGALVIPYARAEEVLETAKQIEDAEQAIIAEVMAGSTLREARKKMNYHHLQTGRG